MKSLLLAILIMGSVQSWAWDQHHFVTKAALQPIAQSFGGPVLITPFEEFLNKTFPGCSEEKFWTNVVGGVGRKYKVQFSDYAQYSLTVSEDLFSIETVARFFPEIFTPGRAPFPGAFAQPLDILSNYSDEPDWLMDMDVPYKVQVGLKQDARGTGSNVFRHFWFGKDETRIQGIETLTHTQRMFDIALAAFSAGETYWGYRFLAQALHYLQDVTQPFHSKMVPSMKMVRRLEVLQASLCDYLKKKGKEDESCKDVPTSEQAFYLSALSITTYHFIYENYIRELFSPAERRNPENYISGMSPSPQATRIVWKKVEDKSVSVEEPVLDLSELDIENKSTGEPRIDVLVDKVAARTREAGGLLGETMFKVFSSDYKEKDGIRQALLAGTGDQNPGVMLARGEWKVFDSDLLQVHRLIDLTYDLLSLTGQATRLMTAEALMASPKVKSRTLDKLRKVCRP